MAENSTPSERRPTGIAGLDRILEGGLLSVGRLHRAGPAGRGQDHPGQPGVLSPRLDRRARGLRHAAGRIAFPDVRASAADGVLRRGRDPGPRLLPRRLQHPRVRRARRAGHADPQAPSRSTSATLLVVDGLVSAHESAPTDREFKKFLHEIQTLADLTALHGAAADQRRARERILPRAHHGRRRAAPDRRTVRAAAPAAHPGAEDARQRAGPRPALGPHHATAASRCGRESKRCSPRERSTRRRWPPARSSAFGVSELDDDAARRRAARLDHHAARVIGQRQDRCSACSSSRRALKRGERAVYFGFFEHPEAILAKCQRVGIGGLREGVERGTAADRLASAGRRGDRRARREPDRDRPAKLGAQRLLIDGMRGIRAGRGFSRTALACLQRDRPGAGAARA